MKSTVKWNLILLCTVFFVQCSSQTNSSTQQKYAFTNALINETSPYLLQHAHNPVFWYPWGAEALDKAGEEDKLLIISVGYAACHWCHVMEEESFEDTTVSSVMNEHFISIKVDREERPDIDDIYMTACQMVSETSCGWPLNAIALPNGKPVWAGTYFPRQEWLRILEYFVEVYQSEPGKLQAYADQVAEGIQNTTRFTPVSKEKSSFDLQQLEEINQSFLEKIDLVRGGRRGAPKFPVPDNYRYLMQVAVQDGYPGSREAVTNTLDQMGNGGIYDHLGGGFARYSTDAEWHVPHFEKMLYDNAQLISLYANAYKWTRKEAYLDNVRQTIGFLNREMRSPEGAFYSSLDADSEGEEGKFYTWTQEEVEEVIGQGTRADAFMEYFDIRSSGNWEEGKNVLRITQSIERVAHQYQLSPDELEDIIAQYKQALFEARSKRVRPGLDDKVLTAWNALTITGLVDAFEATGETTYLDQAIQTGNFLRRHMLEKDGRINRNFKAGKVTINGFLDDYAHTIEAFINLYQATFDEEWLYEANKMTAYTRQHFLEEESMMFYYTSDLDPDLIARKMDTGDNVIPGSNSTMAHNLYRLGLFFYDQEYLSQARQMLRQMLPEIRETGQPQFYSNWCRLLLDFLYPPYEVAIVGPEAHQTAKAFLSRYAPRKILLGGENEGTLELLEEKLQPGRTLIYVCQNKVCKYPVASVAEALELME